MSKFDVFVHIARSLNLIGITPLLMGSVGFERVTGLHVDAQDIDIHVPGDQRGWEVPATENVFQWENIMQVMESLDFTLIDLHEHAFSNGKEMVEFGIIDTLPDFAGIKLEDLEIHTVRGVRFYLLTPSQYLRVYEASSKDSYRVNKNNDKDQTKIQLLENLLGK
ncbi:phosphoribosylanthranilate isomerase [Paenalkalicoccus suaedae]|uniref:Phosphoribosylanthranilate isomerase n=1 Tax=Paenalkalicoccus suaedae TaxID=2592382 RepID=A0A859FFT8_9BACI|nr:phosphoribosylanthranilate isomerase [Paenalkalicoccus suaedae]QKS71999.1 phosphoribosylanthranilate isomerase [Paenalkalicoccus suaedae]